MPGEDRGLGARCGLSEMPDRARAPFRRGPLSYRNRRQVVRRRTGGQSLPRSLERAELRRWAATGAAQGLRNAQVKELIQRRQDLLDARARDSYSPTSSSVTSEASSVPDQEEPKEDGPPQYSPSSASQSTSDDADRPGAPEAFQAARVARAAEEAAVRAEGVERLGSERLVRWRKRHAGAPDQQRLLEDRRWLLEKGFYSFLCERVRPLERELREREDEEDRRGLVFDRSFQSWAESRVRVVHLFLCERIHLLCQVIQRREDNERVRKRHRALLGKQRREFGTRTGQCGATSPQ